MKKDMKLKGILTALCLILCMLVPAGLTAAYFSNNERSLNVFTVGDVRIEAEEPSYDSEKAKDLEPGEWLPKDPVIENTGSGDAIVFFTLSIPVMEMNVIDENGKMPSAKTVTELFTPGTKDEDGIYLPGFGKDWVLLRSLSVAGYEDGSKSTYVLSYNRPLHPGEKTEPVFDAVRMVNYSEGELSSKDIFRLTADAGAVQAADIIGKDGNDLTKNLTEEALCGIYNIYVNQNGTAEEELMVLNPDDPLVYDSDGLIKAPAAPYKEGYIFKGWQLPDGSEAVFPVKKEDIPAGGLKLTPVFAPVRYKVLFTDAFTGESYSQELTYDTPAKLLPCRFAGKCSGWSLSENGAVVFKDEQNVKNLSSENGAVIKLYVRLSAKRVRITFSAGGGKFGSDDLNEMYISDNDGTVKILRGSYAVPERKGYKFAGWFTDPGCAASSKAGFISDAGVIGSVPENDTVLYAGWKELTAQLIRGDDFSSKYKKANRGDLNYTVKYVMNAETLPKSSAGFTVPVTLVSESSSECPVYIWVNDDTLWIYSEASRIYLSEYNGYMFYGCKSLLTINALSRFDASRCKNMDRCFSNCTSLQDLSPIKNWDVSGVEDMQSMFYYTINGITDISPLKDWDVSSVKEMKYAFGEMRQVTDFSPLDGWKVRPDCSMLKLFNKLDPAKVRFPKWYKE